MKISKLQYITQDSDVYTHSELTERACKSGVKWVQLRMKDKPEEEVKKEGLLVKNICKKYQATFILNDYVNLAKEIGADGVHLGKDDIPVSQAREILGKQIIIGGTANTFNDIEQLSKAKVNYIGLGPFRFTNTKKNLSPILGLQGYDTLMHLCKINKIQVPIIAIGGITERDISDLLKTGVHGIAVSSAITNATESLNVIDWMNEVL